eukprot:1098-Heterococcus_DN1.PRE.2
MHYITQDIAAVIVAAVLFAEFNEHVCSSCSSSSSGDSDRVCDRCVCFRLSHGSFAITSNVPRACMSLSTAPCAYTPVHVGCSHYTNTYLLPRPRLAEEKAAEAEASSAAVA